MAGVALERGTPWDSPDFINELNTFALAVLRPEGEVIRSAETLRLLLTGLQLALDAAYILYQRWNTGVWSLHQVTPFGACYLKPLTALTRTLEGQPCLTAAAFLQLLKSNAELETSLLS